MTYVLDDDCELPPHLVTLFLRTASEQMQKLTEACARHDMEATRACAHKLKGSLYAAGASRLAEHLEALRANAAAGDWTKVGAQLEPIRVDFASVIEQLHHKAAGAP